MRRLSILLLAGLLASCVAATPTTAPSSLDLTDEHLLDQLGAPVFGDVAWERTVDDLTVVGSRPHPDPGELELLTAALREIPGALMDQARPREMIRISSALEEEQVGKAVAFTKGPDIYLVDRTFDPHGSGTTRLDLARALAHEMGHVAQFMALDPVYIQAVLDGELERVDPADGSRLVRDFAAASGWTDTSSDPLHASWHLDGPAATDYGATGPAEDMSESIAMVVMGRANWIPDNHSRWVEDWLGTGSAKLAAGKPWIPAGSTEVLSAQDLYDVDGVTTAAPGVKHRGAHYFELPADIEDHLVFEPDLEHQLAQRGLFGTFARVDMQDVPHYEGLFARSDGVRFWVELWDFRGTGPDNPNVPLLAYVELW
ncbi:MAG: hypothetical protein WAM81_09610 [Acidimicrobiia bacterium]